jgi:hypothetical protein
VATECATRPVVIAWVIGPLIFISDIFISDFGPIGFVLAARCARGLNRFPRALCAYRAGPTCVTRGEAERRAAHQLRVLRRRRPWSGTLAARRSTAVSPSPPLRRQLGPGPRFAQGIGALCQRAPRGRLVVARRAEPRGRPSAGLRSQPAGTASCSIRRTPPDGRPSAEQGVDVDIVLAGICQGLISHGSQRHTAGCAVGWRGGRNEAMRSCALGVVAWHARRYGRLK